MTFDDAVLRIAQENKRVGAQELAATVKRLQGLSRAMMNVKFSAKFGPSLNSAATREVGNAGFALQRAISALMPDVERAAI